MFILWWCYNYWLLFHRESLSNVQRVEKPWSTIRIVFFDLASAFNADQTFRSEELSVCQTARLLIYMVTSNTNTPQGTVPLQFMITLYIFCFNSGTFHLQKFSNDFWLHNEEYRDPVENFAGRCDKNHKQLNIRQKNPCCMKWGGCGDGWHLQVPRGTTKLCTIGCYRCSTSVWWPVSSPLLWCAREVALEDG